MRYTEEEKKLILNRELSPQRLSKLLGRSVGAMVGARTRLRKKLGIKAEGQIFGGKFRPYWSKAEDLYLREMYPKQDISITASELKHRTPGNIRARASKLGVHRQGDNYLNAKRFGEVFGVSCSTVRNWILRGLVSASKGSKRAGPNFVWVIQPSELVKFIRNHREAYDPSKLRDSFPSVRSGYIPITEATKYSGYTRSGLTCLARKGRLEVYKGFGPAGRKRWYFTKSSLDSLKKICPACRQPLSRGREYCNHNCYLVMRRRRYHESRDHADSTRIRVKTEVLERKAHSSLVPA